MHRKRDPWDLSAFEIYQVLLGLPERGKNPLRFLGARLAALDKKTIRDIENDLNRSVDMSGLAVRRGDSAWSRCEIRDAEAAREVLAKLDALAGRAWRDAQSEMTALVSKARLVKPFDLAGWQDVRWRSRTNGRRTSSPRRWLNCGRTRRRFSVCPS